MLEYSCPEQRALAFEAPQEHDRMTLLVHAQTAGQI
jgi:hypothetical protein